MKKFLAISFATLGLSTVSSAAVISCSASNPNVITNGVATASPLTFSCGAITATSGSQIVAIALRMGGSFNDDNTDGSNSSVTFSGISTFGATQNVTTTSGEFTGSTNPFQQVGSSVAIGPATSLSASTVDVTWIVNGPAVKNATASISLVTTEELIPGEVPEPSTFILLGSALTGLGVLRNRRKA